MRYGVFSDIHADLTAAREVIERLRSHAADFLLCLGDIVGYGPQPNECVQYIAGLKNCVVLAGNHDRACCGRAGVEGFGAMAADSVLWTREMLSEESKKYLAGLPLAWKKNNIIAAHASPVDPALWTYVTTKETASEILRGIEGDICFIGHTHDTAVARLKDGVCKMERGGSFNFQDGCKYLVNVGSAGYLRRRAKKAAYAVYDDKERRVELYEISIEERGSVGLLCI